MAVMRRFIISPPFGNYLGGNSRSCTRIMGSFTWQPRRGLLRHTARSLRKIKGGWINQIGLRNRGIRRVEFRQDRVYSLVGLEDGDWEEMLDHCPFGLSVEVNLGCPNVHEYGISPEVLKNFCRKFVVSAKLPPTDKVDDVAAMCVEAGVRYLHLSNTIPTARGGESGQRLYRINQPIVARMAAKYPRVPIIAGGGIYSKKEVAIYRSLGAKHFSLATVWFTPWRVPDILESDFD